MVNLSNKLIEFKKFYEITDDLDQEFKLGDNGALLVRWGDGYRLLTNSRNPNKFLAKTTMQYKLKYGIEFLRVLKITTPKKVKKEEKKNGIPLDEQIKTFKKFHNIATDIPELKIVDNRLSGYWSGAWFPVSQKNKNKPLANSTLQRRYGESFLRAYKISTVKRKLKKQKEKPKPKINPLSVLPFNQFKYDKDFRKATSTFFDDEAKQKRPRKLILTQLPNAVGNYLKSNEMIIPSGYNDPVAFFNKVRSILLFKITKELEFLGGLKYSIGLEVILRKDNTAGGQPTYTDPPSRFYSKQTAVLNEDEINLDEQTSHILESIETFVQNGSGWKVHSLMTLWLDFAKYEPIKGASYLPLPIALKNKRAVINVMNYDDNCLRYTLRAALHPAEKHPERLSSYPKEDNLNFNGIDAPTPVSQIHKVEKLNNLAINVYGWERGKVIIHIISKQPPEVRQINIMIIEDKETGKTHYVWVKHFNRLLASQHKNTLHKYYCERCLIGYTRTDLLEKHIIECRGINERAIRIEMPTEGKKYMKFENHRKQLPAPWVIYMDYEAITTKIEGPERNTDVSFTHKIQLQEACGYCVRAVRSDGMTIGPFVYRGPDAVKQSLKKLQELEKMIIDMLEKRETKVYLTKEETAEYREATTCWICEDGGFKNENMKVCLNQQAICLSCARKVDKNSTLERPDDFEEYNKEDRCKICACEFGVKYKVRDHDHITGKYRGAAHSDCNFKLQINPKKIKIPVFCHGLRGYDAHHIMQYIGEMEGDIKCIPNNLEKYISFSLGRLEFKDSAQFLLTSLAKLVESNKRESFKFTKIGRTEEELDLLTRKGVYPYDYMDSWERFEETKLPPFDAFYSKLSGEGISAGDYAHAKKVWRKFGCKNMGDYHDLYLRTDVDLLADVFEEFRNICMQYYKLDPANYYTSPGLSWDALLKKTKVKLELLTDYDMHLMVEKGLRGGISMVSKRYAKANNPLVGGYDKSKNNSYIMYLDANNLYGWAMVQHLPTGGFEWVEDVSIDELLSRKLDAEKGYICEVDITYPEHLHDTHNDYPLAPEKLEVRPEWLSEYQKNVLGKSSLKVKKLVPNLRNKEKYVVHYRTLQLYVSLGMRVSKVHRVLEFDQSPWMAPYIEMNTELRKQAQSDFEKDFFKLMNNSVFGKTMENLRRRINIHLIKGDVNAQGWNKLRKLIAKPSYAGRKTFNESLTAIHMYKDKLCLNRPIYVGMCILDLSKTLMYDYYYNKLKKQYGNKCQLLYTDTDSLLIHIETEDVYKDMRDSSELYDTSNFNKHHELFSEDNKKVLGKFKDECGGVPIKEYVGLRPKMYSIITEGQQEFRKAKGVKKCVVKNEITHENYKQSLFGKKTFRHGMNMLRSYNHQIYAIHLNKISLSPLDTKRWIADDGVNTLAYGHYKTSPGGN